MTAPLPDTFPVTSVKLDTSSRMLDPLPGSAAIAPVAGNAVTAAGRLIGAVSPQTLTALKRSCAPSTTLVVTDAGITLLLGPISCTPPSFGRPSTYLLAPMLIVELG